MRGRVVAAAVAAFGLLATGCDDGFPGPSMAAAQLSGRQEAELDVVSGADTVLVSAADLGDQLFRAWTPAGARVAPRADLAGDAVRVSLAETGGDGGAHLVVELNTRVLWRIRLDGGASQESVAMATGRLAALDFGAGSARIDAALPAPHGTVPVRMAGGASVFDLRLPQGVAAQVRIGGGAGQASIDGTVHTGIAGGTVFTPDGWPSAGDRYLIDNTAGVSTLSLDRITA
jgi:hypothetical protein